MHAAHNSHKNELKLLAGRTVRTFSAQALFERTSVKNMDATKILIFNLLLVFNLHISYQCPLEEDAKAAYKSGEIPDQDAPITLDKIKNKLKESEIFNWQDASLSDREKKEMNKLFDAVEIMTTSRNRQPSSVQNMFSSLRLVERAVKKQLKEGQLSESLAAKFHWDKLSARHRREKPSYHLDKATNMRVFNLGP